ncbi:MAG: hypothetical protein P9L94_02495 [Candidatus Hinthialibacter antarcticus]|nr:hypothetical protein [Candidatus Hinthialibacter antarcticus]
MRTDHRTVTALCCLLGVVILFGNQTSIGKTLGSENRGKHSIKTVKNLILDYSDGAWSSTSEETMELGQRSAFGGRVDKGIKLGGINGSGQSLSDELYIDPNTKAPTIDVDLELTFGQDDSEVRGAYTVHLPQEYKRIQLQAGYDLFLDSEGKESPAEFHIDVYERPKDAPESWQFSHRFESEPLSPNTHRKVFKIESEQFTAQGIVCNLSEWTGREVRIDLVSRVPKHVVATQKGRWTKLSIIGMTFDIRWADPKVETSSGAVYRVNNAVIQTTTPDILMGSVEDTPIHDLAQIPDNALNTFKIGSTWYASTHATLDASPDTWGSILIESTTQSFFAIGASDIDNNVYRTSGTPTYILDSPYNDDSVWYNYSGICSSFGATNAYDNNWYIHAFYHAEDFYENASPFDRYGAEDDHTGYRRVGYARSTTANDPHNFSRIGTGNSIEMIRCFQPETSELIGLATEDGQRELVGAGAPSVIKIGSIYYMFYTRWLNLYSTGIEYFPTPYTSLGFPVVGGTDTNYLDNICVARIGAHYIDRLRVGSVYNQWHKYYDADDDDAYDDNEWLGVPSGNFEEWYSTSILPFQEGGWRAFPSVHYNEALNMYVMVCTGDYPGDANGAIYMHVSDGDPITEWSEGFLLLAPSSNYQIAYPSIIGSDGYDEEMPIYHPEHEYGVGKLYFAIDYDQGAYLDQHDMARIVIIIEPV